GGTVISANPPANTFTFRDLTVTGGGSGGPDGGAFQMEEAAHTLVLVDVAVNGNVGASNGGAIELIDGSSLDMTGGSISGNTATGAGGGIDALDARVTLRNVTVSGNTADEGGAIHVAGGVLDISGSVIEGNEATTDFGGIRGTSVDAASLFETTLRNNTAAAGASGGGSLDGGALTVRDTLVDGNTARAVGGLGLSGDQVAVQDSAVINNTATTDNAGGMFVDPLASVPVSLVNVTISGNRAGEHGGGLFITGGPFVGTNLTVSDNSADYEAASTPGDGGGIYSAANSNTIRNSIVFGNHDASPGAEGPDCFGEVASGGSNIIGTLTGCTMTPQATDKIGVDPLLLPLADNGGDTPTYALQQGSPAIDAADPAAAPPTDQRGAPRTAPDIGAYELAFCKKVLVNEVGTEGNDTLTGGDEATGVLALGGNDVITTG
ncbi:MAG: choice-of-anchor Q domain-containing protein, partial [Actinomycetota bacterium]